ncbi:UvrD-helicase domain-containing protein [Tuwongella immobilis]|uniref:DNA 3'-5' helicase n=1 Tax=Tuwongella immobilis TaxID=692036 RepID=A0A6C2YMG6_9BACT|nr:UvrD-helicase domain-containing protein [Tuwongella immobilis]VIP02511.1 rep helicase : DNA helicase OS=Planctomyces maris DSM 8797 GN=PM8797T_01814 PE=4 SV=1: UvrD-helicase: UvrD_C [Tuwongella immobilis]VTS01622.1 rep helicase : DNA helicase OS=Planctomyces maris DSM 8797 GN=PM8797T_01814 PE=4 SV=1: UvrD-helicase: UvrD_C [Tuwongella immobilis]
MSGDALMPRNDRLTIEQRNAVDRRGSSVVLSSGAGCGKTHVLTARYLRHLREDQVAIGQLVAITFTDRAARQMRERIRQAIRSELAFATSPETRNRWERHLQDLEQATITTIHSFCGNILRQNAFAAGLDPSFEVLDDVLAENLRNESLWQTLRKMVTAEGVTGDALRDLIVRYGWQDVFEIVRGLLRDSEPLAWREWIEKENEQILVEWKYERERLWQQWVPYVLATVRTMRAALRTIDVNHPTTPEFSRKRMQLLQIVTRELRDTPPERLEGVLSELHELALLGRGAEKHFDTLRSNLDEIRKAYDEFRKQLQERFREFCIQIQPDIALEESVEVGKKFLEVALEVVDDYQRRKRRANVVDFHDLIQKARDLLLGDPAARESLRQRFQYILLDELQDTDRAQMELVKALCGGGVVGDKLFAVGDHKQSIYRFRGAEVQLFLELRRDLGSSGQLGLTTNFRSQPQILEFVNWLFSRRIGDYEHLQPSSERRHHGHCVEFLWATPERGSKFDMKTGRQLEADAIARRILDLLDDPTPRIWDTQRNELRRIERGDIVLLFRSMTDVSKYETALRRHGIDYYLIGGKAFYAQQEIYDVLNLLRALENPWDDLSLAGVLRSPFAGIADETLFRLCRCRDGLWKGLSDESVLGRIDPQQRQVVERARDWLIEWRSWKDRLLIADLLRKVVADSGYDAALQFEYLGERKLANLWKLIDLARNFDRSGLFSTVDFIARLQEMVDRMPPEEEAATLPESADVVKLMTIHQSKGLEYPVVFVVQVGRALNASHQRLFRWHPVLGAMVQPASDDPGRFPEVGWKIAERVETIAEWEESLRLMYVACTRARDLLILSAPVPHAFGQSERDMPPIPVYQADGPWMMALAERFHLRTGHAFSTDRNPAPEISVIVSFVPPEASPKSRRREAEKAAVELPSEPPLQEWPAVPKFLSLQALEHLTGDRTGSRAERFRRLEGGVIAWESPDGRATPWERLADFADPESARRHALLRRMLPRWNPDDSTSVSMTLARFSRLFATGDEACLVGWFQHLMTSEAMTAWRNARDRGWLREIQLRQVIAGETLTIAGIVDGWWRDPSGGLHLLWLDAEPRRERIDWPGRAAILRFACQQLGETVVGVHRLDLLTGRGESRPADQLEPGDSALARWLKSAKSV